jgi:hypothetical protein
MRAIEKPCGNSSPSSVLFEYINPMVIFLPFWLKALAALSRRSRRVFSWFSRWSRKLFSRSRKLLSLNRKSVFSRSKRSPASGLEPGSTRRCLSLFSMGVCVAKTDNVYNAFAVCILEARSKRGRSWLPSDRDIVRDILRSCCEDGQMLKRRVFVSEFKVVPNSRNRSVPQDVQHTCSRIFNDLKLAGY